MDMGSNADQHKEIQELKQQLYVLRHSLSNMEEQLDRYSRTEQSLRQSEERFRLLVMGVRDYAIFMLDTEGHIVSWNTGAKLIKGYSAEEIVGRHFSIFYPPEDIAAEKPARELEIAVKEGVYEEEGWRLRKDGSRFWANVVITALFDEHGVLRGFGKVTRDLTERKQAEEARLRLHEQELQIAHEQAARIQAEANVRLRDAFLNATAHEFRTPVTSVLGYAQLLQRRFERGEFTQDRVQKPVKAIALQAQRLARLTTMLLDISRLEHGKLTLERAPVDLRACIERIVQELQLLTEEHTISLDLPDAPLIITTDELRFEQTMYNLVQNAMKYSPVGGAITVKAWREGSEAIITVTDNGLGIPPEDLSQVFDRFYRATNISSGNISGLGLGLYLVKEFVAMHDGTVVVQSTVGQGTTFRLALPLTVE